MLRSTKKFLISAFFLGLFILFASLLLACGYPATVTLPGEEAPSPNDRLREESAQTRASSSAPNLHFDCLSASDGLSFSSVMSILQDERGFMWFGTALRAQ